MNRQSLAIYIAAVLCAAALSTAARAGTVAIDLVGVGDVGNVADPLTGYGSVGYSYSIGKYDVTMAQYVSFLSAVAATSDPYGLYNTSMATATPTYGIIRTSTTAGFTYALRSAGSANVPVTYVNWGDAARFVNWLQNGEPVGLGEVAGSTETGSYALNGSTGSAALIAVTRGSNADWILPNVNEWYKSAYYAGGGTNAAYWLYPTQNNNEPSNVLSASGTNNANYTASLGQPPVLTRSDPVNWLTAVGSFTDSPGPYLTFDQGGDVDQWLEDPVFGIYREARAGAFASDSDIMLSTVFGGGPPNSGNETFGFRVAYVPEPNNAALLATAALISFLYLNRHRLTRQ